MTIKIGKIYLVLIVAVFSMLCCAQNALAAPPTITSIVSDPISPVSLLANSSISLTINGTGFTSGSIVEIVGPVVGEVILGTSVIVVSDSQITCSVALANAYAGSWDVAVTNSEAKTTSTGALFFAGDRNTYTSPVQDSGYADNYGTLTYNSTLAADTTITVKFRAGNTSNLAGDWTTLVDASTNASGSADLAGAFNGNRYYQYQTVVEYSGSDPSIVSTVDDVSVTHGVEILYSSPYNTTIAANKLNSMTWDETKPGNSDVVFQIRTAPTSGSSPGTWTSWVGPDGTVATWFTDPTGGEFVHSSMRDGSNDQWLQYRAILIPDGENYPTFSNFNFKYYTTLAPVITSISPVSVTSITNPATSVTMTINGLDFMAGAAAKITNAASGTSLLINASSTTVVNTTRIEATFNFDPEIAYAGTWDVTITNADNTTGTSVGAFTILNDEHVYTSSAIDLGAAKWFNSVSWNETVGTSNVKIRTGNTATPDETWTDYVTISSEQKGVTGLLGSLNNNRYVQYTVTTVNPYENNEQATFDELQLSYSDTNNVGDFDMVSSPYDTSSPANILGRMEWNATTPTNTSVKFQLRSAPDSSGSPGAWTDWMGPDGTAATYFTAADGTDTMPSALQSGDNDQWIQYKAVLGTTDPGVAPTLASVSTYYVVNSAPEFDATFGTNGVDVEQISDPDDQHWGKVGIRYAIRDIDTETGNNTANYVTPSFQYSLDGGSNWTDMDATNIIYGSYPEDGNVEDRNSDGKLDNKVLQPALDGEGNETSANYLTYTIYWDAKTQIPEEYSNEFQIRVTINDNEGANNIANAIGNQTILDTKKPEIGTHPVLIDATTSTPTATLDATDDSTLKMEVNLDNLFGSVLEEDYSDTREISLASDPDTVYVQFQDIYGNTSGSYQVTTPETPVYFMVQDTSNVLYSPPEPRLFLAWRSVGDSIPGFDFYQIYRSEDRQNWESFHAIHDRALNYYADDSVNSDQDYYYRVVTVDQDGNKSYNSQSVHGNANGIQDAGEGGGGTSTIPPVISNLGEENVNTSQAAIVWDTDTLSDSTVGYYEEGDEDGSYDDNVVAVNEMKNDSSRQGRHKIVLTNLEPNTTYSYQARSKDISNNETTREGTFTTLPGPKITVVNASASNHQVTITWRTDTDSNSIVNYSTSLDQAGNLSNPIRIGEDSSSVGGSSPHVHEQTINNLTQNTVYYFSVESNDGENTAIDNNGENFYSFTTTLDEEPPVISEMDEPVITSSRAAIHWITDEPATSQVRYRESGDDDYTDTAEISTMDKGHYVILSGLLPNTRYYYRVISRDISGNSSTSAEADFTTSIDEEFNHDPVSRINNIEVPRENLSDTNAVVTFDTDQATLCFLELSTSSETYTNPVVAYENGYSNEANYNKSHAIRLIDLIPETEYFFKITCHDNIIEDPDAVDDADKFANWITSDEEDFVTLERRIAESLIGTGDLTPPQISNVKVSSVTGESVTITWDTDENSNSLVNYGINNANENSAGEAEINFDSANYSKAHSVIIRGLVPDTKYLYVVGSSDIFGNVAKSSETFFKTASPSSISSIKVESKNLGEALITWKTNSETTSIVEYGIETPYEEKKENSDYVKEHSVLLTELKQGEIYHFRLKGMDKNGNLYASADNTFEPKSPPKITGINMNDVSEHEATITFATDVPTDSNVMYTKVGASNEVGSQGSREMTRDHKVTLENLEQGTTYSITISARDEQGIEATVEGPDLTTGKDENPPKIDQVRTDSALTQNDKVQTIISWKTDEQATTSVLYREGRTGQEKELKVSDNMATSHIAVITAFKPGTVYNFRAKSIDASENEALSGHYTLLTPRKKENIIQIITKNFQDIFGWVGKTGGR